MIRHLMLFFLAAPFAHLSPVPSGHKETDGKVLYDQRQEGEWNVRADLKNFVILIIPTQSSSTASPGTPGLLDFLSKSIPKRSQLKRLKQNKQPVKQDVNQETMHFIESKTAPYHVDISRSRNHLAKLHPENVNNEDIIIANSPSVSLVKTSEINSGKSARLSRALVFTVPADEEYVVTKTEDNKKVVKKDGKKKTTKEVTKPPIKLIGAENEQCGPGLVRDSYGNCRTIKN